jgi:hypothetical protein
MQQTCCGGLKLQALFAVVLQAAVVEVKCPTPYYPVNGKPWAFGVRGSSGYRPYKCMKAHYYCQAQLNMLVTGVCGRVASLDFLLLARPQDCVKGSVCRVLGFLMLKMGLGDRV